MAFTLYRLAFSDPLSFYEQMGDPITSTGGAPTPAQRAALRHTVSLASIQPQAVEDTPANRLKLRRQWRSLVNNTPMKLQGLYLAWDADPENSGWYMPDQGQLVDIENVGSGLSSGIFKVEGFTWIVAGRQRTHRRAAWIYMKDLRTGEWARDFRRVIYNTDFATREARQYSYLPPSSFDAVTTGGFGAQPSELPVGADGGRVQITDGLIDLARVSWEQIKSAINLGQVVVYDRRGEQTGPTAGPGTSWEEFYGPDFPFSWTEGSAIDTPVIENGRCRVRFDSTGKPGFRVDVWATNKWEEQGKVVFGRINGITNPFLDTLVSASLAEYSETRAVVQCVMKSSVDQTSREEIFITLQRGWSGPRFEIYPAPKVAGTQIDAYAQFAVAVDPADITAFKPDTTAMANVATATGTGHTGKWPVSAIGTGTFTLDNYVGVGRWGAPYGVVIGVRRAPLAPSTTNSEAYGSGGSIRNAIQLNGTAADGYLGFDLAFPPQVAQQAMEAESMTLGAGSSTASTGEASGGTSVTASRTTDANPHTSQTKWPNGVPGVYRVFARVAGVTPNTLKLYAKTPSGSSGTKTYVLPDALFHWVDLGEVTANNNTLEIHMWANTASAFYLDRIEALYLEDRFTATYTGARDFAQGLLFDSRVIPTIVSRST